MVRKEIRQKQILNIILEEGRIPSSREIAERLEGVTDRTIRRDLEEIAGRIAPMVLEDIPRELFLTVRKKIPTMKEHNLIALMAFFIPKKSEIEAKGDFNFTLLSWRPEKEGGEIDIDDPTNPT